MSTRPPESMSYREVLGEIDPEQARVEFEQFSRDCRYLSSIRPQLREHHPDCWVAVYEEKVAAVGTELSEVFSALTDLGIPKSLAALKFITKEPRRLIL